MLLPNGDPVVVGGYLSDSIQSYTYPLATMPGAWVPLHNHSLPGSMSFTAGQMGDGNILISRGANTGVNLGNPFIIYNPVAGTFNDSLSTLSPATPLQAKPPFFSLIPSLTTGDLYALMVQNWSTSLARQSVWRYDYSSDEWVADVLIRTDACFAGVFVPKANGDIFYGGGYTGAGPINSKYWDYDATNDTQIEVEDDAVNYRGYAVTAMLDDGRYYMMGGQNPGPGGSNDTFIYDPGTNTFSAAAIPAPTTAVEIDNAILYSLNDGRLMLIMGTDASNRKTWISTHD
jgi:hypothetical protein